MTLLKWSQRTLLATVGTLTLITACKTTPSAQTKTVGVVDGTGQTQLIFKTADDEIVWVDCKKSITANDGKSAVAACIGNEEGRLTALTPETVKGKVSAIVYGEKLPFDTGPFGKNESGRKALDKRFSLIQGQAANNPAAAEELKKLEAYKVAMTKAQEVIDSVNDETKFVELTEFDMTEDGKKKIDIYLAPFDTKPAPTDETDRCAKAKGKVGSFRVIPKKDGSFQAVPIDDDFVFIANDKVYVINWISSGKSKRFPNSGQDHVKILTATLDARANGHVLLNARMFATEFTPGDLPSVLLCGVSDIEDISSKPIVPPSGNNAQGCALASEPGKYGNGQCFEGHDCCSGTKTWECRRGNGAANSGCKETVPSGRNAQGCLLAREPGKYGNPQCFHGASCCRGPEVMDWVCNKADGSSPCGSSTTANGLTSGLCVYGDYTGRQSCQEACGVKLGSYAPRGGLAYCQDGYCVGRCSGGRCSEGAQGKFFRIGGQKIQMCVNGD